MNHVSKRATLVIRTIETPLGLSEIEILLKIVFLKLQFKKYVFFFKNIRISQLNSIARAY